MGGAGLPSEVAGGDLGRALGRRLLRADPAALAPVKKKSARVSPRFSRTFSSAGTRAPSLGRPWLALWVRFLPVALKRCRLGLPRAVAAGRHRPERLFEDGS